MNLIGFKSFGVHVATIDKSAKMYTNLNTKVF